MLQDISLSSIALTFILAILAFILLYGVVLPYMRVQAYRSPEAEMLFFPILGIGKVMIQDLIKKGDIKATSREFTKKFPGKKYIVSNLGTKACITLCDPQYLKEMTQRPYVYKKHSIANGLKMIMGEGLILSDGDSWKRKRKLISSVFNYDLLKQEVGLVHNIIVEFLNKIDDRDLENYPILDRMQEITGEAVGRIFFGEKLSSYSINGKSITTELAELVAEMGEYSRAPYFVFLGPKVLSLPIPQFKKLLLRVKKYRDTCFNIIQDRKTQKKQDKDLLGLLLATQTNADVDARFTDQEILDEFTTFFVAGMDTTAATAAMLLYNLTQRPEYIQDLEKEIKDIYDSEKVKSVETLQKMDVAHSMIKETLRINSPFPFVLFREVVQDHKIGTTNIKKGDVVEGDLLSLLMDENTFENASQFNPNRWRDPNMKLDPYAFIPFSAGPRNCIGQHLAVMELKMIVCEFLKRFDFRLKEGYKMKLTLRLIYEPLDPVLFNLSRKKE